MNTRRICLTGLLASAFAAGVSQVRSAVNPVLVYADGLMPGWWIGGWAKHTVQVPLGDQKPVEVNMEGWNALTFQTGAPLETTSYTNLILVVHGGDNGTQTFMISAKLGDKVVSQELSVSCVKGDWAKIIVPLKKMKIKGPIDTLFLNNKSPDRLDRFYINYVLFQ